MNKNIWIFGLVFILLSSFVSALSETDTEHYYDFDESSGTLTDLAGSIDGTNTGVNYQQTNVAPNSDYSYSYDGGSTEDRTAFGTSMEFPGDSDWSIDMWFNLDNTESDFQDIMYCGGSGKQIIIEILNDAFGDKLNIKVNDGTDYETLRSNDDYDDGNDHYIVISYDSTTDKLSVDIDDGTESLISSSAINFDGVSNEECQFSGRKESGTNDYFIKGRLDEVGIYNKVLTPTEITQRYGGLNYPFITTTELTASNIYDGFAITEFSALFTNSSGTTVVVTNNGSIYWNYNDLVNLTVYNLTGDDNSYFNRTYINYNTTSSLNSSHWQSVAITEAKQLYTGNNITDFNTTIGTSFNESNSSGQTIHYVDAGTYDILGRATGYGFNSTEEITLNNLDIIYTNLTFYNHTFNITAVEQQSGDNILSFTARVEGTNYSTTNGSIYDILTPNFELNITMFSTNTLTESFLHNASANFSASLRTLRNYFGFFDNSTGEAIVNASVTVTSPSGVETTHTTNSTGQISFISPNDDLGFWDITLDETEGYVTPVTFTEGLNLSTIPVSKNYSIFLANIIVNIYNRETGSLLDDTEVSVIIIGSTNETTETGTISFSNVSISAGLKTVVVLADGYFTEERTFIYSGQQNVSIDFYMLNLTGENTGLHFVSSLDEFYITQPESFIELFEYNELALGFIKVSEGYTDSNGETVFAVELNQKKYIISGSKTIGGLVYTDSTNPAGIFISVDNSVTQLFLKLADTFYTTRTTQLNYDIDDNFNAIYGDETNTTSVNVTWSTYDNLATTLCVDYYTVNGSVSTLVQQNCLSSASGIIQTTYDLDRNYRYNVQVYQLESPYKVLLFDKYIERIGSLEQIAEEQYILHPLVLVPHLLLLGFALWSRRIITFFIGEPIIIWAEFTMFPSVVFASVSVLITFVCLFMIKVSLKKRTDIS